MSRGNSCICYTCQLARDGRILSFLLLETADLQEGTPYPIAKRTTILVE